MQRLAVTTNNMKVTTTDMKVMKFSVRWIWPICFSGLLIYPLYYYKYV